MKIFRGVCLLFVDQGYEGHPWAFQDAEYMLPPSQDHPDGYWPHEGLHILKDGDELTIFSDESEEQVLWSGTLLFVDDEPTGVDREALLHWFREEHHAALLPSEDEEEEHE
jgi:hypothetical protein